MCQRCSGKPFRGFAVRPRGKGKGNASGRDRDGRTLTTSAWTPETDVETDVDGKARLCGLDAELFLRVSCFLDVRSLCALAQSSSRSARLLARPAPEHCPWRASARSEARSHRPHSALCFSGEPDVFEPMPGELCPDDWRGFLALGFRKRAWLEDMDATLRGSGGSSFVQLMRACALRGAATSSSASRVFSRNDVTLVDARLFPEAESEAEVGGGVGVGGGDTGKAGACAQVEELLRCTLSARTTTLSSGTVAVFRECARLPSGDVVRLCSLYPTQAALQAVSYEDMAHALVFARFFGGEERLLSGGKETRGRPTEGLALVQEVRAVAPAAHMSLEVYAVSVAYLSTGCSTHPP